MIKNHFETAWRNLRRYKSYSIINMLGLTLGIAACIVIFLVVKYELSYDDFNSKANRIYRVTFNQQGYNPSVSMAIAPAMRNNFPELEEVSQVWFRESGMVTVNQKKFNEKKNYAFADQYFTSVFDYTWLEGNAKTALSEPNTVVLTESLAHKYFGNNEAMNQVINLDNEHDLKVTGVIKDLPGNTHLPFNFLVSFETIRKKREDKGAMSSLYWISDGSFCYIVTPQHYNIVQLEQRMPAFVKKNWGNDVAKTAHLLMQPLTDIHFDTRYLNNTISYTTSRETYYALAAVAILIIIIACINFINLATAQAIRRAKEVGVRKVLGSSRPQLIIQFLSETAFIVIIALLLGLLLAAFFLPKLSAWLYIKINMQQFAQPSIIVYVLMAAIVVIVLAGLYPAFIQSAFNPVQSLKSKAALSNSSLVLRKTLVVVQFAISQVMIIGTLVVASQMDFFENRNLGFDKDAVISFEIPDLQKTEVLKQQLQNNPGIKEISFSSGAPVYGNNFTAFVSPQAGITNLDVTELKFIDEPYTDMFGLKMLAGDKVRRTNSSGKDTVYNVVVNEAMISKLGISNPQRALGRHITINGNWQCTIQGVVKNFQSESKHKKIRPCVLLYRADQFSTVSVKLQPAGMNKTIATIDKSWSALFPDNLFSYEFLDDHIAAWYSQEQKEYTAFKLFSAIAIIISCLGLYGLIAFAAAQRTKEVGIRKVLGASIANIVFLFSKEFVLLIGIAFLIAAPLAYYIMNNWLQSFAYQINIGINIFVIAILSSFVIAGFTIAYQAIKAAVANPVKSLRAE